MGWQYSKTMETACVMAALDQAVTTQRPPEGLILHSDRGSQYTSHAYRHKLIQLGMQPSFSAKGCPYDNAPIESFHAILKKEFVYRTIIQSYETAKLSLFESIEGRYHRNRIHSSLTYKTPQQMEDLLSVVA